MPGTVLGPWDIFELVKQKRNINITNKPIMKIPSSMGGNRV